MTKTKAKLTALHWFAWFQLDFPDRDEAETKWAIHIYSKNHNLEFQDIYKIAFATKNKVTFLFVVAFSKDKQEW